jgi:hypothetical protein
MRGNIIYQKTTNEKLLEIQYFILVVMAITVFRECDGDSML